MALLRALTAGLAALALLAPAPALAQPASVPLREQVAALRAQVDAAAEELAAGAVEVERARERLGALTSEQVEAAVDLDETAARTSRAQSDVDALARAAYKGGLLPPTLAGLLTGDPRALADLARVRTAVEVTSATRAAEVRALADQRARRERALADSERLRREGLRTRQQLEQDVAALSARADRLAEDLDRTARALESALVREAEQARAAEARRAAGQQAAQRAARQAAQGAAQQAGPDVPSLPPRPGEPTGQCAPAAPHGYANGFLPDAVLCPVLGGRLRTDAARALAALSATREAATGEPLCVTDTYRSYPAQVDVFRRKPALAAVPGRSQHGWGLAVDLCGGVERFGTEAHAWMREHGPSHGWVHPSWAREDGSRPEAWHWEYAG